MLLQVLNEDGKTTHSEDQVLTVEVQPGWPAGTEITFHQRGDQGPSVIPGTRQFHISLILFSLSGCDLYNRRSQTCNIHT